MTIKSLKAFALITLTALGLACTCAVSSGQEGSTNATAADWVEYDGILRASRVADISPRFDGLLQTLTFQRGDIVEEGTPLAQLLTLEQRFKLTVEEAAAREAKAQLALAEAQLERARYLRTRDTVSQAQLDQAVAQRDVAAAALEGARTKVELRKTIISEYTLYAPFDGVMSARLFNEGSWITLGARDDNRIATIRQTDPIHVETSVPYEIYEHRFAELGTDEAMKRRLRVRLKLPNGEIYEHEGRVIGGADQFDAGTQTIKTIAEFPNPDYFLRPGLQVRIESSLSEAADE